MIQRKDDTAAVLKSRLEAFHRQTEPVCFLFAIFFCFSNRLNLSSQPFDDACLGLVLIFLILICIFIKGLDNEDVAAVINSDTMFLFPHL